MAPFEVAALRGEARKWFWRQVAFDKARQNRALMEIGDGYK